jgi:ABC-type Fe3+-siderophore transport system permease subunit
VLAARFRGCYATRWRIRTSWASRRARRSARRSACCSAGTCVAGTGAIALLAFGSGLLTLMLALELSRQGGQLRIPSFLLVGVSLSASLWGVITLLLVLAGEDLSRVLYWLLGGLLNADWTRLGWASVPALVGCGLLDGYKRAR